MLNSFEFSKTNSAIFNSAKRIQQNEFSNFDHDKNIIERNKITTILNKTILCSKSISIQLLAHWCSRWARTISKLDI